MLKFLLTKVINMLKIIACKYVTNKTLSSCRLTDGAQQALLCVLQKGMNKKDKDGLNLF